jgi:hypothetical protein
VEESWAGYIGPEVLETLKTSIQLLLSNLDLGSEQDSGPNAR